MFCDVQELEESVQEVYNSYDERSWTYGEQLATPTGLTANQITSTGARIGWNAVANASGYKVEYKQHDSNTWIEG